MSKWISIEDRLPEDEGLKVVRYSLGEVHLGIALSRYWVPSNLQTKKYWCFEFGSGQKTKVTHWMNLPESPS